MRRAQCVAAALHGLDEVAAFDGRGSIDRMFGVITPSSPSEGPPRKKAADGRAPCAGARGLIHVLSHSAQVGLFGFTVGTFLL